MTLVERMARAMAEDAKDYTFERTGQLSQHFRSQALAALRAMREQPEDIEDACWLAVKPFHDLSDYDLIACVPGDFFRIAFRTILDAALSEAEREGDVK